MKRPYYEHAGITIYHGKAEEIVPELNTRFNLLLTDPPYGIGFASQPTKWQRRAGMKPEAWDDEAPGIGFLNDIADTKIIWGGNYFALPISRGWLSWCKPDAPPSMGSMELAWTNMDNNARHFIQSIAATNGERVGHPTQKPLALMKWCITQAPEGVKSVFDPFMGSGTTLVAAKVFGLTAVGIDQEEAYCEIAARRLAQEVMAFA